MGKRQKSDSPCSLRYVISLPNWAQIKKLFNLLCNILDASGFILRQRVFASHKSKHIFPKKQWNKNVNFPFLHRQSLLRICLHPPNATLFVCLFKAFSILSPVPPLNSNRNGLSRIYFYGALLCHFCFCLAINLPRALSPCFGVEIRTLCSLLFHINSRHSLICHRARKISFSAWHLTGISLFGSSRSSCFRRQRKKASAT